MMSTLSIWNNKQWQIQDKIIFQMRPPAALQVKNLPKYILLKLVFQGKFIDFCLKGNSSKTATAKWDLFPRNITFLNFLENCSTNLNQYKKVFMIFFLSVNLSGLNRQHNKTLEFIHHYFVNVNFNDHRVENYSSGDFLI